MFSSTALACWQRKRCMISIPMFCPLQALPKIFHPRYASFPIHLRTKTIAANIILAQLKNLGQPCPSKAIDRFRYTPTSVFHSIATSPPSRRPESPVKGEAVPWLHHGQLSVSSHAMMSRARRHAACRARKISLARDSPTAPKIRPWQRSQEP